MIEIERKFLLDADTERRLVTDAEFVNERTFTDSYFDTRTFTLTLQDKWLRTRNGKFQLKLPAGGDAASRSLLQQYEELEEEAAIKEALGFSGSGHLSAMLAENGYAPFATLTTVRKKFKKGIFALDFDEIDFGYRIAEIEIMVEDKSGIEEASRRINEFAKANGLTLAPVRSKVHEYLKRNDPTHFQALASRHIIPDPEA